MEPFRKTVFIEYSSASEGQHLITVVEKIKHERVIIGRIYRDFDPQTKKASYRAYDFEGNPVFFKVHNLYELKNKFKEHGKSLSDNAVAFKKAARSQNQKIPTSPVRTRLNDIKTARTVRSDKEKIRKIETEKTSEKHLNQMEREQDDKNQTHYKDLGEIIDREDKNEPRDNIEHDTEEIDTDSNIETEEHPLDDDISDREMELEEIRDNNDDREQDQDHDIDL